jgi:hypothetical protein
MNILELPRYMFICQVSSPDIVHEEMLEAVDIVGMPPHTWEYETFLQVVPLFLLDSR